MGVSMRTDDFKAFRELLTNAMAYYRQDVSPFVLDLWWQACQAFELKQVSQALTAHAMDPERGQFAPKVADLVRLLGGTHTERAALAWGKAHTAASDVGAYADVVFDDPAIHATIEDLGGWVKFCRTETKELSYLQHRFTESYRTYVAQGKFDYPRVLPGAGSSPDIYLSRGIEPPNPRLVGDQQAALRVQASGTTARRIGGISQPNSLVPLRETDTAHQIEARS